MGADGGKLRGGWPALAAMCLLVLARCNGDDVSAAFVLDPTSGKHFDTTAAYGDVQHMTTGTCPGPTCVVGPLVSIQPNARTFDEPLADSFVVIARITNLGTVAWTADSTFQIDSGQTKYWAVSLQNGECRHEYLAAGSVSPDSLQIVGPRPCAHAVHSGWKHKRAFARWSVGSTAAWVSCNRNSCCRGNR